MVIIGITAGTHSSGICAIKNGIPVFSFEEERFVRVKYAKDFENDFFRYPFSCGQHAKKLYGNILKEASLLTGFWDEHIVKDILRNIELPELCNLPYIKVSHHEAHCNAAYYLSNFQEDAFVISMDGFGTQHSAKFYLGSNGNLSYIDGIDSTRKSFGHYYTMLTEFLGWRRIKDEGKVVGMSSYGKFDSNLYDIFNKVITIDGLKTDLDSNTDTILGGVYRDFYNEFFKRFGSVFYRYHPGGYDKRPDIAFNGQLVFEEKILQIVNNLHKLYPHVRKIALGGGVFANIKVNKRINDLPWVDEVFVTPPMGDEGLPLGSCFAAYKLKNPEFKPFRIKDMFLGVEYSNAEVESDYWDRNKFLRLPYNAVQVAEELANGKIVGIIWGKYEHGPRALCNRSIVANPSLPNTYDKINRKLQRNDYMPFAPVVIDKYVDDIFQVHKSRYTAEFMTMLYDTKKEWIHKLPAVIHPKDHTARIQIVTNLSNPKFYDLINNFNNLTNIPVLLNTSFNVHDEPIVCSPKEGFVHLENGIVDLLVVGDYIFYKNTLAYSEGA